MCLVSNATKGGLTIKYDKDTMHDVRMMLTPDGSSENTSKDAEIEAMPRSVVLQHYLECNGILGHGNMKMILGVIQDIYKVELKD